MGKEAEEKEAEGEEEALDPGDVLLALAIQARENPETINAKAIEEALEGAGLGEIWEAAGEEDDEEDDEELGDEADEGDEEDDESPEDSSPSAGGEEDEVE